MKITLPENISEITLGQFMRYEDLINRNLDDYNFNKRKIEIFAKVPFHYIDNIKQIDFERILNQIDLALTVDAEFKDRFVMHDIEFGFIPNLDKMTLAEYADLTKHGVDKESLPNLMAVLFRPVINKQGEKYSIMHYEGTEGYADMMKDMPLNVVNGALVFFCHLANELAEATLKYLTEELRKDMQPKTTSPILDGILQLKCWLKTIFRKSQTC